MHSKLKQPSSHPFFSSFLLLIIKGIKMTNFPCHTTNIWSIATHSEANKMRNLLHFHPKENSFQFIKWHWLPNDWTLITFSLSPLSASFGKSVKNIYGNNLFFALLKLSCYLFMRTKVVNLNDTKTGQNI